MRNPTQSTGEVETPSEPTQSTAENTSTDEVTAENTLTGEVESPAGSVVTISVPQRGGEIVMRRGGTEPVTYAVTDHAVSVDDVDVEWFVAQVDGAKPASGKPAVKKES